MEQKRLRNTGTKELSVLKAFLQKKPPTPIISYCDSMSASGRKIFATKFYVDKYEVRKAVPIQAENGA